MNQVKYGRGSDALTRRCCAEIEQDGIGFAYPAELFVRVRERLVRCVFAVKDYVRCRRELGLCGRIVRELQDDLIQPALCLWSRLADLGGGWSAPDHGGRWCSGCGVRARALKYRETKEKALEHDGPADNTISRATKTCKSRCATIATLVGAG